VFKSVGVEQIVSAHMQRQGPFLVWPGGTSFLQTDSHSSAGKSSRNVNRHLKILFFINGVRLKFKRKFTVKKAKNMLRNNFQLI